MANHATEINMWLPPLLLQLLYNLRTLDLRNPQHFLDAQAEVILLNSIDSCAITQLRYIRISVDDPTLGHHCSLHDLNTIASIPSLKTVQVRGLEDTNHFSSFVESWAENSKLEKLIFEDSIINSRSMVAFLRNQPRPTHMSWEESELIDTIHIERVDAFWLGVALQLHNKDTLQELVITSPQHSCSRTRVLIGDISALHRIRTLEIYSEALFKTTSDDKAILPRSLRRLRIYADRSSTRLDLPRLFDYLSNLRSHGKKGLSHLRKLELVWVQDRLTYHLPISIDWLDQI